MASQPTPDAFWDVLHAALGLQHTASSLAENGEAEAATVYEREALALLLEATCMLDAEGPALVTVRQLAVAGLARLDGLKRQAPTQVQPRPAERPAARPRRKRVAAS